MERDFFKKCRINDFIETPGRTITESDIVSFASFTGDWNALHTDAEYAKSTIFGERVAHGLLTLVIGSSMLFRHLLHPSLTRSDVAIAGLDKVRFIEPVRIGDTIHLEGKVAETITTPDGKNIVQIKFHILNQHKKAVIKGRMKLVTLGSPSQA
jgi:acyl dehydratase